MLKSPIENDIENEVTHILDNKNSFSLIHLASLLLLKLQNISNPLASIDYSVAVSYHNYGTGDVKHPWATLYYVAARTREIEMFRVEFQEGW